MSSATHHNLRLGPFVDAKDCIFLQTIVREMCGLQAGILALHASRTAGHSSDFVDDRKLPILQLMCVQCIIQYGWLVVWLFGVLVTAFVMSFGIRVLMMYTAVWGYRYLNSVWCFRDQVGKYFVFLVPVELAPKEHPTWQGKLHALEKMIGNRLKENEENASKDNAEIKKDLSDLEHKANQMAANMTSFKSQLDNLEIQNARIEDALCRLLHGQPEAEY